MKKYLLLLSLRQKCPVSKLDQEMNENPTTDEEKRDILVVTAGNLSSSRPISGKRWTIAFSVELE